MIKYIYLFGIAIFLFASCQREDIPPKNDGPESELIKINGDHDSPVTKTTLNGLSTTWQATDKIGIYCAQAKLLGGVTGVKNAEFTAVTGAPSSAFTGTMFWGTGVHYFYAYYPYSAANSSVEATALPITLPDIQTQTGSTFSHIGAIDYLVATPIPIDPTEGESTVDLTSNHVFSMIEFKVLIPLETTKLRKIEITTSSPYYLSLSSGTIDITQAEPAANVSYVLSGTGGTMTSTLNISGDCIVTNDSRTTAGAMLMVLPGNHTGYHFTVKATTDRGDTTVLRDGVIIKRNNKYNLTITIPFIDLKTAARFGILSGDGISNVGSSIIKDMDIGISPGFRAAITGFLPEMVLNGSIYASNDDLGTADMLTQAKQDLTAAYLVAEAANTPSPKVVEGDLGGQTLTPGIYKSTSSLKIETGHLTLDAQYNTNAFWVFQIGSTLTTIGSVTGGNVLLINGAQAKNVFWQVGSSATIGDNTSFMGNILALTSITMNTGAVAEGRMLARNGEVVLTSTNIINKP